MKFVHWRLNEPIDEPYRPTKVHATRAGAANGPDVTLCGVVVPEHCYDVDWFHAADEVSCKRCERLMCGEAKR